MKASEARWVHCSVNLSIYTTFVLDMCERVVESRVDGKTDAEALGKLVGAFTVRDHWRQQALMLEGALPELGGDPRELAESALENYRKADGVMREILRLAADKPQSSGFVVH